MLQLPAPLDICAKISLNLSLQTVATDVQVHGTAESPAVCLMPPSSDSTTRYHHPGIFLLLTPKAVPVLQGHPSCLPACPVLCENRERGL